MKFITLIICVLCAANLFCQTTKENEATKKTDAIKLVLAKLVEKDTLAYEHYLIAKRCFCRENYLTLTELRKGIVHKKKTNDVYELYDKLREAGYVFFVTFDKIKLASSFDKVFFKEMVSSRNSLSSDHLSIDDKNIICEAISSPNKSNHNQFMKLISNKESYSISIDYNDVYEDDTLFLKEIIRYYSNKKKRWYNLNKLTGEVAPR